MKRVKEIRGRGLRLASRAGRITLLLLGFAAANAGSAAAQGLNVELNQAVDRGGNCQASFLIRNDLGETLDRFGLELYLFDADGVVASRFLVDLAPLPNARTTPVSFPLGRSCSQISRVLIAGAAACRAEASGAQLDCMAGMKVVSRAQLQLEK